MVCVLSVRDAQVGPLTPVRAAERKTRYWSELAFWKVALNAVFAATVAGTTMPSRAFTAAVSVAAIAAKRGLEERIFGICAKFGK